MANSKVGLKIEREISLPVGRWALHKCILSGMVGMKVQLTWWVQERMGREAMETSKGFARKKNREKKL